MLCIWQVKYHEDFEKNRGRGFTPVTDDPITMRVRKNMKNIWDKGDFKVQIQGHSSCVWDTPEMRRVQQSQRNISMVKYHEEFQKSKGRGFTPVSNDLITERVKRNMQDVSDICYKGMRRHIVEMESSAPDFDATNELRVWRTNPGSVFDYDPAEDNIQSRSLHLLNITSLRRGSTSRSASAQSASTTDGKSELSEQAQSTTLSSGTYEHGTAAGTFDKTTLIRIFLMFGNSANKDGSFV
uniref:Uncharacterized protein n=1 Tax=Eptatretus burgeri TaxID=7764 RepID=A0A8C4N6W6_EPTBU